ncbi:hypothetical protein [Nocardia sp. NBC_01388]|uniref:hypothetical protein n=1 Tax=Nocardia sp. NBC_01388 TaxID=2903596 RepID=UPI003243A406
MPTSKKRKRTKSTPVNPHRTNPAPAQQGVGFHDEDLIDIMTARPAHLAIERTQAAHAVLPAPGG